MLPLPRAISPGLLPIQANVAASSKLISLPCGIIHQWIYHSYGANDLNFTGTKSGRIQMRLRKESGWKRGYAE